MESYSLVSHGELLPGLKPEQVMANLTALKVPESTAKKLVLDKHVCVLKRHLNLADAKHFQARLEHCGLHTEIDLRLSAECLHAGLGDSPQPTAALPLLIGLKPTVLQPVVIALPGSTELEFTDLARKAVLEKIGYSWSPLLLVIAVLLIAVYTEIYLVRFTAAYLGWRTTATVGGILFLVAAILVLLRLLQPLSAFVLRYGSQPPRLILEDHSLHPTKKKYRIFDADNALVSSIMRNKKEAIYSDKNGEPLYIWTNTPAQFPINDEEIQDIHNNAVSDLTMGPIGDYLNTLGKIWGMFIPKRPLAEYRWDQMTGTSICDADGNLIAVIYRNPTLAVKINRSRIAPEQEADIVFFVIAIVRPVVG